MTHYQNTKTARERVRDALMYQLAQITEANGYFTTVGDIFPTLAQRADAKKFPAIVVLKGSEYVTNVTLDSEDLADDALHKVLEIDVLCYHKPELITVANADTFNDHMLADLEYLFGNNWMLKGQDGVVAGRLVVATGSLPFTKLVEQNYTGIAVKVRIRYSQDIHDPTISV